MEKDLLNEIIQLKEEKKVLEAASGSKEVDPRMFTKSEKEMMRKVRDSNRSMEMLKDIEKRLWEDEVEFKEEHH